MSEDEISLGAVASLHSQEEYLEPSDEGESEHIHIAQSKLDVQVIEAPVKEEAQRAEIFDEIDSSESALNFKVESFAQKVIGSPSLGKLLDRPDIKDTKIRSTSTAAPPTQDYAESDYQSEEEYDYEDEPADILSFGGKEFQSSTISNQDETDLITNPPTTIAPRREETEHSSTVKPYVSIHRLIINKKPLPPHSTGEEPDVQAANETSTPSRNEKVEEIEESSTRSAGEAQEEQSTPTSDPNNTEHLSSSVIDPTEGNEQSSTEPTTEVEDVPTSTSPSYPHKALRKPFSSISRPYSQLSTKSKLPQSKVVLPRLPPKFGLERVESKFPDSLATETISISSAAEPNEDVQINPAVTERGEKLMGLFFRTKPPALPVKSYDQPLFYFDTNIKKKPYESKYEFFDSKPVVEKSHVLQFESEKSRPNVKVETTTEFKPTESEKSIEFRPSFNVTVTTTEIKPPTPPIESEKSIEFRPSSKPVHNPSDVLIKIIEPLYSVVRLPRPDEEVSAPAINRPFESPAVKDHVINNAEFIPPRNQFNSPPESYNPRPADIHQNEPVQPYRRPAPETDHQQQRPRPHSFIERQPTVGEFHSSRPFTHASDDDNIRIELKQHLNKPLQNIENYRVQQQPGVINQERVRPPPEFKPIRPNEPQHPKYEHQREPFYFQTALRAPLSSRPQSEPFIPSPVDKTRPIRLIVKEQPVVQPVWAPRTQVSAAVRPFYTVPLAFRTNSKPSK